MEPTTKDASRRQTVLLVDDAPENLSILSAFLSGQYRIKAANSGANALRICSSNELPDLILLDLMMPELDGFEVCKRLKDDPRTREIPVIFVTAATDSVDEAHGLAVGAVDYITKPFSPAVVLERVRVHLELKRVRDRLNRLGRHFSSYLSSEVASGILRGAITQGVVNQRKPLTIFFSDIVEFTKQTAALPPERMARMLNGYFDAMADIVSQHHGTLDKYIGDACMVFFGDPTSRGAAEDARSCVRMALEMQCKIDELQTFWKGHGSGAPLSVRMGIATGLCAVGNFGSTHQLAYTVMGTAVNLAARLQAHAMPGRVLISEETYALVGADFPCRALPEIRVKGLDEPVVAYEVEDAGPR